MYVKDYMSSDLITITEDTKILEALDLMKENDLHRLPVVKSDNPSQLVGLLTEGNIQENSPSKASSLSIHEMNYLLTKTDVRAIMIKEVITIHPNSLLEQAAALMRHHNIGCLPVVEDKKLVGIITQNDIFDAFIHLLGYYQIGCHVVIDIEEERPGNMADIGAIMAKNNLNMDQIVIYRKDNQVNMVLRVASLDDQLITSLLKEAGYTVLSCVKKENI